MVLVLIALLGILAMIVPLSSLLNSVMGSILVISSLVVVLLVGRPLMKIFSGLLAGFVVSSWRGGKLLAASQFV